MFLKELSKVSRYARVDYITITMNNPKKLGFMRPTVWNACVCIKHPVVDTRIYTNLEANDHEELLEKIKKTVETELTL